MLANTLYSPGRKLQLKLRESIYGAEPRAVVGTMRADGIIILTSIGPPFSAGLPIGVDCFRPRGILHTISASPTPVFRYSTYHFPPHLSALRAHPTSHDDELPHLGTLYPPPACTRSHPVTARSPGLRQRRAPPHSLIWSMSLPFSTTCPDKRFGMIPTERAWKLSAALPPTGLPS